MSCGTFLHEKISFLDSRSKIFRLFFRSFPPTATMFLFCLQLLIFERLSPVSITDGVSFNRMWILPTSVAAIIDSSFQVNPTILFPSPGTSRSVSEKTFFWQSKVRMTLSALPIRISLQASSAQLMLVIRDSFDNSSNFWRFVWMCGLSLLNMSIPARRAMEF